MQNLAADKLGEYEINKLRSHIKEIAPQVAQLLKEEPDRGGIIAVCSIRTPRKINSICSRH
ncbi:hypothetical protein [Mastigocoleus sp. MO_188.B34]|uniref:hypothetical protein n=1 Tax=Mastigocoleus sp. MO_188.B34 TaxID=3036635 RepID=UPI00261AEB64|nr:hypothetical protein [Mastigocoleus sp. MO_188.B34]MDJ0695897.1 hypothetical protein [Mastigocoleus sp. MO_188.B34]